MTVFGVCSNVFNMTNVSVFSINRGSDTTNA